MKEAPYPFADEKPANVLEQVQHFHRYIDTHIFELAGLNDDNHIFESWELFDSVILVHYYLNHPTLEQIKVPVQTVLALMEKHYQKTHLSSNPIN